MPTPHPSVVALQIMSFLGTTTGQQVIATGAFNATGAALVAGLASNVANVTAGATALASQINRAVSSPRRQPL